MLKALSVRNYVLIDSLEIDFPEGLIIITGQTGAGKSIILGALSLLMGAKADAEAIAEGAETCSVEAEFETEGDAELLALLKENDLGEGGSLILRRVVNRSGRSRAFVNDFPVNLPLLTAVAGRLVDIHSQHQNLLLADHRFQLSALDLYAGNGELLENCREAHSDLLALRSELSELSARLASLNAERDYNESVFRRLDGASLKDGELEELEAEQERLANAEDIKENLCLLESFFSPGDDTPSPDAGLRNCVQILSRLSRFLPEVGPLQERLSSARIEIADIAGEVASLNSRFEVSMDRLQAVEERLSTIYGLLKTYSCRTVSELIALKDKYSDALFDSDSLEMRKEELEKAVAEATARLDGVSAQLHAARMSAAGPFSEAIMDSLRFLELERAVFSIEFSEVQPGPTGTDSVRFLFSADGRGPAELSKCASGGELSRIMLSLKAMMARYTEMPTLFFDEIDSGVSGSAADRMGSMICDMGRNMQVFAITHLPQVAAKGDAHYLVSKSGDASGRTVSSITRLDEEERVMEVARMLSGTVVTDAAVANARALLKP
ncbi:MAG: DNA repair protein RecN [Bacteroidales bacterium]|nr:DNA repair protein RecN [Bacteroidales bacterium]